jgi:hypothetical protein
MNLDAINNIDLGIGTFREIFTIHNLVYFGIGFVGAYIVIKIIDWKKRK